MNNARVFKLHSGPKGSTLSHPQSQDISGLFIIQQAGALDASRWASSRASFDFLPTLFTLACSHVAPQAHMTHESQMSLSSPCEPFGGLWEFTVYGYFCEEGCSIAVRIWYTIMTIALLLTISKKNHSCRSVIIYSTFPFPIIPYPVHSSTNTGPIF